jgi:flavin-dependent dehydrogenase
LHTLDGVVRSVKPTHFDVAVIGAGPAGSTAALVLARRGLRVLIAARPERATFRIGEGLPPAARPFLQSLGLWQRFRAAGHLPCYGNKSAWGSSDLRETSFLFNQYGHGWHLDRHVFDRMLLAAAQEAGAVYVCMSDASWHPTESGGLLTLRTGTSTMKFEARLVLDCSGRAAAIATRHRARRLLHDKLIAVAALHATANENDVDSTTLVEAVADGWWYTALLPQQRRIFVFLTDGDLVDVQTTRKDSNWIARLGRTRHLRSIHERFGYRVVTRPAVWSAGSSRLSLAAGRGWIAAGDAAISFDPLSSQGILTALSTGKQAAEAVREGAIIDHDHVASYLSGLDAIESHYLQRRAVYYATEQRWPTSPFWQRRAAASSGRRPARAIAPQTQLQAVRPHPVLLD